MHVADVIPELLGGWRRLWPPGDWPEAPSDGSCEAGRAGLLLRPVLWQRAASVGWRRLSRWLQRWLFP